MKIAELLQMESVLCYEEEADSSLNDFVSEAKKRNIFTVFDLKIEVLPFIKKSGMNIVIPILRPARQKVSK